jgi:hypothetical protein
VGWDDTDHDHIMNWRAETFRPTSLRHSWEWTTNTPADALDTELGGEEIRAQVYPKRDTQLGTYPPLHADPADLARLI